MEYEIIKNTLNTEQECREYLASIRWRKGFCCPKCNGKEAWVTSEIKYKCKKCGHKMSVTSGTVFQDSHISLKKWFLAISIILKNKDITLSEFQKQLELGSNRTAIRIKELITNNTIYVYKPETNRLLEGHIEVTRKLFRHKNNRIIAYMAVEAGDTKKRHIAIQREISEQTLLKFLKENIKQKKDKKTLISSPMFPIANYRDIFNVDKIDERRHFILSKVYEDEMNYYLRLFEDEKSFDDICEVFVSNINSKCAPIDYSASFTKTIGYMLK